MIRVGIVDDHAIVRSGLRQFLSEHVDLRVTGEANNGREALDLARGGEVDVMLMDISMPDQSGVDALQSIKARFPDLAVLILSGFPEAHYATTLLRQGASGYLNKECEPEEIVNAIRTVFRGRRYISPAVAELLTVLTLRNIASAMLPMVSPLARRKKTCSSRSDKSSWPARSTPPAALSASSSATAGLM